MTKYVAQMALNPRRFTLTNPFRSICGFVEADFSADFGSCRSLTHIRSLNLMVRCRNNSPEPEKINKSTLQRWGTEKKDITHYKWAEKTLVI